jgi:transposase
MDVMHARCCGIDSQGIRVACLRRQAGRRIKTEVRQYGTTTAELLRLHDWLAHAACTHVAMESTRV